MGATLGGCHAGGGIRGEVRGWSRQSAARHARFLQSVDSDSLAGLQGWAITLTLRDCPGVDQWLDLRAGFFRWLRQQPGVVSVHWVTELQRRGVPHLHLAVWTCLPWGPRDRFGVMRAWVRRAEGYRASMLGQHVAPIKGGRGWDMYCAKHSARTASHYQRVGLPEGWTRSGRLWGRWGTWVTRERKYLLSSEASVNMRRLMRSWAVATAHRDAVKLARYRGSEVDWSGVKAAKRITRRDPLLWSLQGWRCWVPEEVVYRMLCWINQQPGCCVVEVVEEDDVYSEQNERTGKAERLVGAQGLHLPRIKFVTLE